MQIKYYIQIYNLILQIRCSKIKAEPIIGVMSLPNVIFNLIQCKNYFIPDVVYYVLPYSLFLFQIHIFAQFRGGYCSLTSP